MRQRDEIRRAALRMALTAIKNAEVEAGGPLDDPAVEQVLQREIKQRRDSIEQFRRGNRLDLADREQAEIAVLQTYLSARPLSREEIIAIARRVISETGASSSRDIGKVMPRLMPEVRDRADGREVNRIVQELLSSQSPGQSC